MPTIIEMVNHTRLDCVIGSASGMRQAVAQAMHHAAHRSAFGKRLVDQPLMQNVLADLCVESEAATVTMMRLARAYDEGAADERQRHFARLATAVTKYWVCKRQPPLVAEALECLGGNGYVEESLLPRLYREAPLNSHLGRLGQRDLPRRAARHGTRARGRRGVLRRGRAGRGADARLDGFVETLRRELTDFAALEHRARRLVERMALALQGSLLVRHGHPAVADAFCASRLAGDHGLAFGTLPPGIDCATIVERARPETGARA